MSVGTIYSVRIPQALTVRNKNSMLMLAHNILATNRYAHMRHVQVDDVMQCGICAAAPAVQVHTTAVGGRDARLNYTYKQQALKV